jgi:hypothetical protein
MGRGNLNGAVLGGGKTRIARIRGRHELHEFLSQMGRGKKGDA